jgi:hypothetical protein
VFDPRLPVKPEVLDHRLEHVTIPGAETARLKPLAFVDRHPSVRKVALGQISNPISQFRRQTTRVTTQHFGRAACRFFEAEEHANRGRLAAAVSAEKRKDAATWFGQVELIHCHHRTVDLRESGRSDHEIAGRLLD